MRLLPATCVAVMLACPCDARAADADTLEAFLARLQDAVDHDDRRAVASMFRYPAILLAGGLAIPIRDSSALLGVYRLAFTPELKAALSLSGVVREGRPRPGHAVTLTPGGASLAGSFITAVRAGNTFKIARMAPPAGYQVAGARGGEPIRSLFRRGPGTWEASGLLAPYQVEWFDIAARRGETLTLTLDGFRGRDVLARIVDLQTRAVVDSRVRAGVRRWSGQLTGDGTYRIEVIRASVSQPARVAYALSITLR